MNNIILCGFMGCGKTTVGVNLAKKIGLSFIDTDQYIEEKANMKISEIFDKFGEDKFRDMEYQACCELANKKGIIISTGGGVVTYQRNVDVLKSSGTIILIDVPLNTLCQRLRDDTTRPLLQRDDKEEAITELYNMRMPQYKSASDIIIDGDKSPFMVAQDITNAIKK